MAGALATKKKEQKELDMFRDIGPTFSRESLLIVYGRYSELIKEHGSKYANMSDKDFQKLRTDTARKQARMLALHDPQIDVALEKYKKKDPKDEAAVHHNIEAALVNDLVKKAIQYVNKQNDDAKSYARLSVEWLTDNFLKSLAKTAGLAVAIGGTFGLALVTGCGDFTVQEGDKIEGTVPVPAREHATVQSSALMGELFGEPTGSVLFPDSQTPESKELILTGAELPLLQAQTIGVPNGAQISITQNLHIKTRVMYDPEQSDIAFRGFGTAVIMQFSGPIGVGTEFSILGRTVQVVDVTGNSLTIEDAKGQSYVFGAQSYIHKDLLGLGYYSSRLIIDQSGNKAIILTDENYQLNDWGFSKTNSLLLLNTFGVHLDGLNLTESNYTTVTIERGSSLFPPKNIPDPQDTRINHEIQPEMQSRVTASRDAFIIDGNNANEFYVVATQSSLGVSDIKILYRSLGQENYQLSNGDKPIYRNPNGEQTEITLLKTGTVAYALDFSENSGPSENDHIYIYNTGAGTPEPQYTVSARPSLGGVDQTASVQDYWITFRGSEIDNDPSTNTIKLKLADKLGEVGITISQ